VDVMHRECDKIGMAVIPGTRAATRVRIPMIGGATVIGIGRRTGM